MEMIQTEKLVYEYEKRDEEGNVESIQTALDKVSLDVKKGDFIAVLGHNGSGKSTLAKHINAILEPTEGSLWVDGFDTTDEKNIWDIRQRAGMVFQNPDNQIIASVVEEDVGFGPENIGVPTDEIWQRVEESLKAVGMLKYREHSPNKLSGGQKRRVAIAGILAMEPEYFILDEPTAGLDPVGKDQILNLLKKLHEEKKITIILVSHSMEDVADYAQRVIVMNGGQVMYEGDKKEVFSHKKELEEAGLAVPFYRQVCEELADRGFPIQRDLLTLEETKEAILEGLKGLRGK